MPRTARILPDTGLFHIITRGNNRQIVFHDDNDFTAYIDLLKKYKGRFPFYLYHFVLMNNHIHLILETKEDSNLSKIMQGLNLSYVYYYRKRYGYIGHFWQDRFKSLLIEKDRYLLECGKYIEMNPVRAKIVTKPEDYKWSSYKVYAYGMQSSLININPIYIGLGNTPEQRQENYREYTLSFEENVFNQNFYGSKEFISEMEQLYRIKSMPRKQGRPKKQESNINV